MISILCFLPLCGPVIVPVLWVLFQIKLASSRASKSSLSLVVSGLSRSGLSGYFVRVVGCMERKSLLMYVTYIAFNHFRGVS